MRKMPLEKIELFRIHDQNYPKTNPHDLHGMFAYRMNNLNFIIISSGKTDPTWEHVSISSDRRTPNWQEMNMIKNMFWDESETVLQFHPKKTNYVNIFPHCLHLWKKVDYDHELPPTYMV